MTLGLSGGSGGEREKELLLHDYMTGLLMVEAAAARERPVVAVVVADKWSSRTKRFPLGEPSSVPTHYAALTAIFYILYLERGENRTCKTCRTEFRTTRLHCRRQARSNRDRENSWLAVPSNIARGDVGTEPIHIRPSGVFRRASCTVFRGTDHRWHGGALRLLR
jgi:hypothetical protein